MKTSSLLAILLFSPLSLLPLLGAEETATPAAAESQAGTGKWETRAQYLRGRIYHSAVWTYREMIVWGGGSEHQFYNDGGIYDPGTDRWRPVSQENAPSGRWGHAAVWTGTEMIIWGGRSSFAPSNHHNDGAIYNPETDTWRPMSMEGAPTPRSQMAAVWTGQELLVWGGWADSGECPASGGRYDPLTDKWSPLALEGAPEGRMEPAFVWSGREFIVWGGLLPDGKHTAESGGRYNPETKSWKALSLAGAPASTRGSQAVWTGTEMLVWGGAHLDEDFVANVGMKEGGRYNPLTDSWRQMTGTDAPEGRLYYGAAWTGDELVIWSGGDQVKGNVSTGGRYHPATDKWVPTTTNGAPSGRGIMTSVWTGEGVLFYGGSTGGSAAYNETFYYRPAPAQPAPQSAPPSNGS